MAMSYGMGLWTSARCVVYFLVVVRMAIEPSTATPNRFIQILITYITNVINNLQPIQPN